MPSRTIFSLLFVLLSSVVILVSGHGYISSPLGRASVWRNTAWSSCTGVSPDYDDNGVRGGGPSVVSQGNTLRWPYGLHGACGDEYGANPALFQDGGSWAFKGVYAADLRSGSTVALQVTITAYHMGYFEFALCKLDGLGHDVTEECLAENVLACAPGDVRCIGTRYYPAAAGSYGSTSIYSINVVLPATLTCEHCVLRWHYITGNSCTPPGSDPTYSSPALAICGTSPIYPEEFWSCADLKVTSTGGPAPGCTSIPPVVVPTSTPARSRTLGRTSTPGRSFTLGRSSTPVRTSPPAPTTPPGSAGLGYYCDCLAQNRYTWVYESGSSIFQCPAGTTCECAYTLQNPCDFSGTLATGCLSSCGMRPTPTPPLRSPTPSRKPLNTSLSGTPTLTPRRPTSTTVSSQTLIRTSTLKRTPTVRTPTIRTPTLRTPTIRTPTIRTPTLRTPTIRTPTIRTPTARVQTPTTVRVAPSATRTRGYSPVPTSAGTSSFTSIVSQATFDTMFPHLNDPACSASGFTYSALSQAIQSFPLFAAEGTTEERTREIAAFLGQISHETTGGWPTAPGGPQSWGLCFKEEVGCAPNLCTQYCDMTSTQYPCAPGKTYHGRGPMQLSWNYNYGPIGELLDLPLLAQPELVTSNPVIGWKTALNFWMLPRAPKPSCHDVIIGKWTPSASDLSDGRVAGYGMVTNIINGGIECHISPATAQQVDRVEFYKRYAGLLGLNVRALSNLYCTSMSPY